MQDRKVVALVIQSLSTGGAEKLVLELANNIDKTKFDVHVISYFSKMKTMHTYDDIINNDVQLHYLGKKRGIDLKLFKSLKKLIRQINPDIIHAHLNTLLYLIPAFTKKQKKFFTIHSIPSKEATGIQKIIRKFCFKYKEVIPIAISKKIAELTKKYYKINGDVCTIENGICLSDKTKEIKEKNNKKFVIINVSSFKPAKDHITLLDSFKEIHRKYQQSELWLLGDGYLKNEILSYIEKNNIIGVKLYGNVTNIYDYLIKSDMFLLTSIYEGHPLCLLEALSVGLPIVSTNVGGVSDIITNNYNGILVSPKNVREIVTKSETLLENTGLQKTISLNAINDSKKYDIKACAKKHERIYLGKEI